MAVPQVEILFPIFDVEDLPTTAWFVDGGSNQAYGPGPTEGTVAPGALPHQIGTTTLYKVGFIVEQGDALDVVSSNIPPPPPAACISTVQYANNNAAPYDLGNATPTNQTDMYGNYYVMAGDGALIFSPAGSINSFYMVRRSLLVSMLGMAQP